MAGLGDAFRTPYSYPTSEFTTPAEMQQERISQMFGWDTSRPGLEYLRRAVPMMLSPPLAWRGAGPRMNAVGAEIGALADRYRQLSGGSDPRGMSTPAMRRWVDLYERAQPQAPSAPTVGPAPGNTVYGRNPSPQVTQGQRDLYELPPATNPHEAGAIMSDLNHRSMLDPVRSQRYWDAAGAFEAARRPPRNRLNSLAPLGLGAAYPYIDPSGY